MIADQTYDVIVIGAGPGGVEAAVEAGKSGMRTAIISEMPVGGRATYGSLLPSKAWLHAAEHVNHAAHSSLPDPAPVRTRIQQLQKERTAQLTDRLAEHGVEIISGTARFIDRAHVKVYVDEGEQELNAEHIVIAAGSEPRFFPNVKPDGVRIIAPRHTQKLQEIPQRIVMVGGGVTGVEYASAFRKMGSDVHLITDIDRLLPRTDPEVAGRVAEYLERIGVTVTFDTPISSVESDGERVRTSTAGGAVHTSDYAFIATGRRPDPSFLEEATETPREAPGGWLETDQNGRTSLEGVYATGDIAGPPLTANNAHTIARRIVASIVGRPASGPLPWLLEATYTHPQVVHIGPVSELAAHGGHSRTDDGLDGVKEIRHNFEDSLLGRIHGGQPSGLLKLWVGAEDDRIRGAAAFGEHAVEVLAPIQLAMEHEIGYSTLRHTPFAHPALSELLSL